MKIALELEDTFGDIVKKASAGTHKDAASLARVTGIGRARLEKLLSDAERPTVGEAHALASELGLEGDKLADIGLRRWRPRTRPLTAQLGHQLNSPYGSNGYFIMPRLQGVAAVVDPGGAEDNIIETLRRSGAELQYILLTHKHHDHVDALPAVRHAFSDARIVVHPLDARDIGRDARDAIPVEDGGTLKFGDGAIAMMHTPGHTDGSACFVYDGNVFTGDMLFAGSVGRVFGERFGYRDELHSIASKIFALPEDTVVLPGHGPPSTVGEERRHNPFF